MPDWDFTHRWRTWWVRPGHPTLDCDGFENGHWRLMQARPGLVDTRHPSYPGTSFAEFIDGNDVEEDDAREQMKFWVLSAWYVRCGLTQPDHGYVDGCDEAGIRAAGLHLHRQSGRRLRTLDVTVVPSDHGTYMATDFREEYVTLEGTALKAFLSGGPLPAPDPLPAP